MAFCPSLSEITFIREHRNRRTRLLLPVLILIASTSMRSRTTPPTSTATCTAPVCAEMIWRRMPPSITPIWS